MPTYQQGRIMRGLGKIPFDVWQARYATSVAWYITAPDVTIDEGSAVTVTIGFTGEELAEGKVVSVQVSLEPGTTVSTDFVKTLLVAIADEIVSQDLGASIELIGDRLTFKDNLYTSFTFEFDTVDKNTYFGNKTFAIHLLNPSAGGSLDTTPLNVQINETESAPTMSISNGNPEAIDEDDIELVFTVSLSVTSELYDITADYTTVNGTAEAGVDYTLTAGTLTIPAGSASTEIDVPVIDNDENDGTRTFTVQISNAKFVPSNTTVTIADSSGIGTILDDDAPEVEWSISGGGNVTEGSSDNYTIGFTGDTLEADESVSIQVALNHITTSSGDFDGILADIAFAISDQELDPDVSLVGNVLTFTGPNETSLTFALTTNDNPLYSGNKTFNVQISSPSTGGTIGTGTANGTLVDSESAPTVSISDASPNPATEGIHSSVTFVVTLSVGAEQDVTVDWETVEGTATNGQHFTANSGTLTFTGGDTTENIVVALLDNDDEDGEVAFTVEISNAEYNGTLGLTITDDTGEATITDDDDAGAEITLDFLNNALDVAVSESRATSSWGHNSSGDLVEFTSNVKVFEFDPVTLDPEGLRGEAAHTNLLVESHDFSLYTKQRATVTGAQASPDGGNNAYSLNEDNQALEHYMEGDFTSSAGLNYCASIYAKPIDRDWFGPTIRPKDSSTPEGRFMNLTTGAMGTNVGAVASFLKLINDGYYLCAVVINVGTGATQTRIRLYAVAADGSLSFTGDNDASTYVFFANVIQNDFPLSPVFTDGGTAACAASVQTLDSVAFFTFPCTIQFEAKTALGAGTQTLFEIGTTADGIRVIRNASNEVRLQITVASSTVVDLLGGTVAHDTVFRGAIRLETNNANISIEGNSPSPDTSCAMPSISRWQINGDQAGNYWNRYIRWMRWRDVADDDTALDVYSAS